MAAVKKAIQPVSSRLPEMKIKKKIAAMLKDAKTCIQPTETIEASTVVVLGNQVPSRPSTRDGNPLGPLVRLREHALNCQVQYMLSPNRLTESGKLARSFG